MTDTGINNGAAAEKMATVESNKGPAELSRRSSVSRYGHVKGSVNSKAVSQFDLVDEDELHPTLAKLKHELSMKAANVGKKQKTLMAMIEQTNLNEEKREKGYHKSFRDYILPTNIEEMNPEQMKRSYDRRRSTIGKEKDKDTLALANKLAEMHLHAHEYSEAEQYVKLKIEVSKDEKGPLHPDTLAIVRALIGMQMNQRKYRAAQMSLKGTMKNHAKVFGQDFDLTLDTKRLYAECLFRHSRLDECAKLYREILRSLDRNEAKEKEEKEMLKLQASGAAPPAVLSEMELLNKSMKSKYLSVKHLSDKNQSDRDIGLNESKSQEISSNQSIRENDPVSSTPSPAPAIAIKSPENPTIESTKENSPLRQYKYNILVAYSECLVAQELFKEAETTYNVLIELSGQLNGPEHPYTLNAMKTLAWLKVKLEKFGEAEDLYRRTQVLYTTVYGEHHQEWLNISLPFADLLYNLDHDSSGPAEEAVKNMYQQILSLQIALHGNSDLSEGCFETMSRLGYILASLKDLSEAETILRKALRVAEEIYGLKKGPTISIIFRLATIIMTQGHQSKNDSMERNLEMLLLFKRVMVAWKVTPSYGPVHAETLKIIHLISGIYYEQGLNYEAMEMLERALVACERNKSLGKDAMITIEIAFETAKMYRKTGDSASAETVLLRIMEWRSINARGSNSNKLPGVLFATGIDVLRINAEYGLVRVELGRWAEAIDTLKEVLPGYERELGIAHVETLALMRGLVVSLLGQFHEGDYEGNNNLGYAMAASQAVEIARTCAQRSDEAFGKTHAEAILNKKVLIDALLAADKKEEAESLISKETTGIGGN